MPTTAQMLVPYADIMLQVIAELRGAYLDSTDNREQAIDLLAAQITEPTSAQMAYQEITDYSDQAQEAIETLLREGTEIAEAQFSREFGSIRQMGPAKLDRETPWLYPENVAELLYYYGFLGRGIKGTGQNAHTIVYLPSDIVPWLPQPQEVTAEGVLPILPIPPPPAARTLLADDSFLEDLGTLLGFLRTDTLRLNGDSPNADDIDRFVSRLQLPYADSPELSARLALLLHVSKRLGWLRRGDGNQVKLNVHNVRLFLEKPRPEQRVTIWDTWRNSTEWNDLCRTPGLECTNTEAWQNDVLQTRTSVLQSLSQLQPNCWYSLADLVAVMKEHSPNFQRPTGNFNNWYIRDNSTQEFLKGFESWDAVEGSFLRFLIGAPLHWLGAIDLAEPSAGDDLQFALGRWGARWLGHDVPEQPEQPRRPLVIGDDFTITLSPGTPLAERFRVERFAQWQDSYPQYIYQINQDSLKKATDTQIAPTQILDFLRKQARYVPDNVAASLANFDGGEF